MKKDMGRTAAKALRHNPDMLGLELDQAGYCLVSDLIQALGNRGFRADIQAIEKLGENERFSFNEDHTKMRADYGHTIGLRLCDMYPTDSKPPEILYHGTACDFLEGIKEKGIIRLGVNGKKGRDHIFTTELKEVALKKGSRHGKSMALPIRACAMYEDGYLFYHAKNDIWLTDHIPAEYIDFPACNQIGRF